LISRALFIAFLSGYFLFLPGYVDFLRDRPVEIKLGYVPHPQVLRAVLADQRLSFSSWVVIKTLFYYGSLIEKFHQNVIIRPEFANMYQTLQTAIKIDPYNSDAYYFSQASFTWELGRIEEVNHLLEIGMENRTWDESIPFYLGFNHAYFLKDYKRAAEYMSRAAEVSGNPLYASLAARYFYESAQTNFALVFLDVMIEEATDENVRLMYRLRRDALKAILFLESKLEEFKEKTGREAVSLLELLRTGFVPEIPEDPYGGKFYIDDNGKVRTTSKLAMPDWEKVMNPS